MASLGEVLKDFYMVSNTSSNKSGQSEKHCLKGLPNVIEKMKGGKKHLPSAHKPGWQHEIMVFYLPVTSTEVTCVNLGYGKVCYYGAQADGEETSVKIMLGVMESWSQ